MSLFPVLAFVSFILSAFFFLCLWAGWATDLNRIAAGLFFLALGCALNAAASAYPKNP